jgi:two-component system, OmpR family, sensor histidine kinase CpxA
MGRLFLRIFLWFWVGSTCLLLVLAASLLIVRPEIVNSWRVIRMTAMLHLGTRAIEAYEQAGAAQAQAVLAAITQEYHFRVWLYFADGSPIGAAAPLEDPRDLVSRAIAGDDVERASGSGAFLSARRITGRSGKTYVFVWESPFRMRTPWPVAGAQFSLRLIVLTFTGGLVCLWLTLYITRPIRTLRGAARQFAEGNLSVRISERREFQRRDELSELAREFDRMAERIEDLVVSQQQLLGDISHELRSPLARLSLALDLARRRVGSDLPEHQRIEREIHRLNELIEQLLTLARLQGESRLLRQLRPDTVNLRELIHEVAQDARFEAEAAGKTVIVSSEIDSTLRGSRALLRSAIENVVRNAVRHAPEQSTVTMAMTRDEDARRVAIVVTDRGPGVPPQALSRLFDPFYRVDEARDRESGGVGLGLAITRQAMLAHGGAASAENHPEGGLVVRLELPAA